MSKNKQTFSLFLDEFLYFALEAISFCLNKTIGRTANRMFQS